MFLKTLIIRNDDAIIREIIFKKGINLIVDETSSADKKSSGNSVGKTTVLRLIDFCLDGKGENIYIDPEFKTRNTVIETFLKDNNIIITLTLIEDIEDESSSTIEISKNFLLYSQKIQTINGEKYSNDDFSKELKKLIFKTDSKHPSFNQLKSKNIRDEKHKLVNTIRVLAPNVVTDVVYENLHLFWLGIDTDQSKDKLVRDKNLEERFQKRLRKDNNLPQINQSLIIVKKKIEELTAQKDSFNLNEDYEADLSELNKTHQEMSELSSGISRIALRKELIIESKENLEKEFANIDVSQIESLYKHAKALIPNVQKSFKETVTFYNKMIGNKLAFITEELPELEQELIKSKNRLADLLKNEKYLTGKLQKSGAIDDLNIIIEELNKFHEKKGNLDEQYRVWKSSISKLDTIDKKLSIINKGLEVKDNLIQERIKEFNQFFSEISNRLDGEFSLLSAENQDGVYKFKIGNIEGNPGTGSKKSQMASFDLAYIMFADKFDIPCLHFILQDQIENVHSNQITSLLTEIVDEVNCQYILPVLRDKLPTDIDIESMEILSLSQHDKLFKV